MAGAVINSDSLRPQYPGGLGVGALLALLAHVGLVIALTLAVHWRSRTPETVSAELWAAVPQIAAPLAAEPEPPPAPQVKPQPVLPVPPPPQTRDADIAIEKAAVERKRKLEQERLDREAKLREAQKREEQKREAAAREAKRKQAEQAALAKQEAARQAKQREENLRRMLGQASAAGTTDATGAAQQSAGPSATYGGRVKAYVKPNIVFGEILKDNPTAEVEVLSAPDGKILGRRLLKSSGVADWDEAVLRAIDRTQVLPRDTDGRVPSPIIISFRPRD